jgi:hypothetical protein
MLFNKTIFLKNPYLQPCFKNPIIMKNTITFLLLTLSMTGFTQDFTPNYDESKIPAYSLPELLVAKGGKKITSKVQWEKKRRSEILAVFESQMYGKTPSESYDVNMQTIQETEAFGGKATMKEIRLTFAKNNQMLSMDILIYLPKSISKAPLFVGLNFYGNHTIIDNPEISLPSSWVSNNADLQITENKATDASRGARANRWPVEKIIDRGYGIATIYYGDIDPDKDDLTDGVHALFYEHEQTQPAKDEWGSVAGWAWGLSRAMDYFETDSGIDASKLAVMGHSRLGKASLWAGATDERFAIVISNNSGCGGAALSRRRFGETVGRINNSFPHWFCDNFNTYNNNEDALPVDQHMLLALIAPRPLYVASAEDDQWADPKGEYLSALHAGTVYKLYGLQGLVDMQMPEVNNPVHHTIGYHIRTGGHDVKDYDWEAWMDFADIHFGK